MQPTAFRRWGSLLVLAASLTAATRSDAQPRVDPPERYAAAVRALDHWIAAQVADKHLPALSVALVDDQEIVWARGFGFVDARGKAPATAETVYRVGSVSKLFTDIAVMRLVEQGQLDLDAPVTRYLPDFKPRNPFDKPITLRQLMAHRSGLCREPPVGHYFDPTNPTLAQTVESLNRTELVYPPESQIKYSNAGIATVGYVLERTQKQPFTAYLKHAVLDPMGLRKSGFEATPELTKDLAAAVMWTYHGRTFPAPTFPLGMAPAGSMYATVNDLGRFLSVLFAGGHGPGGQVVKPATLEQMWTSQFARPPDGKTKKADDAVRFGIGFRLADLAGHRRIGHGGAMYGFATELAALPDDKLGVVAVASMDGANAVTTHITDVALRLMLAVRQGKPLPTIEETAPIPAETMRRVAGRYVPSAAASVPAAGGEENGPAPANAQDKDKAIDLVEQNGKLYMLPAAGGFRTELRALGNDLVTDDVLDFGQRVRVQNDRLILGGKTYDRVSVRKPRPAPPRWAGLIGEYGWDHNTLYILEKDGRLHALIEWFFLYPLEELSPNVYRFPTFGLYHGEKLVFTRDGLGRATKVEAANVIFNRRAIDGENGETFRIRPLRPLKELRREAEAARPPKETGKFRDPDLVDLTGLDPTIKLEIRYATTNNFLSTPFYASARAFLQRPAAEALVRVHRKLAAPGFGLLVHDAYRPWRVTKMFWEATPEASRIFVANPALGSRHNRGSAVDLTLYDRKTGEPVPMVGGYDEFSDRSFPDYPGGTSRQRWHRDLLRRAMEEEGFTVYEAEWWHFDYKDWRSYPILNLTFEELGK